MAIQGLDGCQPDAIAYFANATLVCFLCSYCNTIDESFHGTSFLPPKKLNNVS